MIIVRRVVWLAERMHRRAAGGVPERGAFAALELTIMVTFIVVMILLIAGFGRVERGRQLVDQAAAAAARAASLASSPAAAIQAGTDAGDQTLSDGGLSCAGTGRVQIDTSQFYAGGQVIANVTCHADLDGLAMAGLPGSVSLHASSAAPIEQYRPVTPASAPGDG